MLTTQAGSRSRYLPVKPMRFVDHRFRKFDKAKQTGYLAQGIGLHHSLTRCAFNEPLRACRKSAAWIAPRQSQLIFGAMCSPVKT